MIEIVLAMIFGNKKTPRSCQRGACLPAILGLALLDTTCATIQRVQENPHGPVSSYTYRYKHMYTAAHTDTHTDTHSAYTYIYTHRQDPLGPI